MAVKTSWNAGDVLTAADLTDTFAAKAPSASPTFTGDVVWSGATLRASTAAVATSQTTTSLTYTDLATAGPAVTVTTGTKALVIVYSLLYSAVPGFGVYHGFAVSGATTIAAADATAMLNTYSSGMQVSAAYLVTGLTAGSNTFTSKYRGVSGGGTSTFANRSIIVMDLGS